MNQWVDYCPACLHYDENTGVCAELHFNVKSYPKKFEQQCGGKYYSGDAQKQKPGDPGGQNRDQDGKDPRHMHPGKVDMMQMTHPAEQACAFCQKKLQLNSGVFHYGKRIRVESRGVTGGIKFTTTYKILGRKTLNFCDEFLDKTGIWFAAGWLINAYAL